MQSTPLTIEHTRPSRSIQEFWIDFLLEEEFSSSSSFSRSFLSECDPTLEYCRTLEVAQSLNDKHGEADLIVLMSIGSGARPRERLALLIEDKITAGFQPNQANRYRLRGMDGISAVAWTRFITVLVAPEAYISTDHGFDKAISFERLKPWLCPTDPDRQAFKHRRIDEAIAKKNTTGVQIVDAEMTAFRTAYYEYLLQFNQRNKTDLSMRPPKPTWFGDTWFNMKSSALPSQAEVRHMATNGSIEISFKDIDFSKATGISELLEPGMALIRTGKYQQHVAVRLSVPKIGSFADFSQHQHAVEIALQGAHRLLSLFTGNLARFELILKSARNDSPS